MAGFQLLSGFIYDEKYKKMINSYLFPVEDGDWSVERIQVEMGADFLKTIKWGDYQAVLQSVKSWPGKSGDLWQKSVDYARNDLTNIKNFENSSALDEEIPDDKCALLDACVRKCFNTVAPGQEKPGIPIVVDVKTRSPQDPLKDQHDIQLNWTYDADRKYVAQLNLTMVCPYREQFNKRSCN